MSVPTLRLVGGASARRAQPRRDGKLAAAHRILDELWKTRHVDTRFDTAIACIEVLLDKSERDRVLYR